MHETNQQQADSLEYILSFNNKTKPRSDEEQKNDVLGSAKILYESRDFFGLFSLKSTKRAELKILTTK